MKREHKWKTMTKYMFKKVLKLIEDNGGNIECSHLNSEENKAYIILYNYNISEILKEKLNKLKHVIYTLTKKKYCGACVPHQMIITLYKRN